MAPSPTTPHRPVLRDYGNIFTCTFVITIVSGVGRGDIWIKIQNLNSAAGIGNNHIM